MLGITLAVFAKYVRHLQYGPAFRDIPCRPVERIAV